MADLEQIVLESREGGRNGVGGAMGGELNSNQQTNPKRQSTDDPNNLEKATSVQGPGGEPKEGGAVENERPGDGQRQDVRSTPEDIRSKFYEDYRKVAEEYDKEFNKRHDEDLNTTLVFAGLFSAVTSAFITEVGVDLEPDPSDETVALLRFLIYQMNNTAFGKDIPSPTQLSGGPSLAIVQVQAMLYASLAVSLFSALLAMLGKQWLNRYESADMRGTVVERSQNRQRKLNGIICWCFERVIEAPPQMLQLALLLLGCAMSRYLWEVDATIQLVVLSFTSFGVIFYLFIVVAGTASENCPYQTPGSDILRSATSAVTSAFKRATTSSETARTIRGKQWPQEPWWYRVTHRLLGALITDAFSLGRAVAWRLVTFARRVYARPSTPRYGLDQETALLDLQCISWILQTSLDKGVQLSALEYLATIVAPTDFDPTLVAGCFNILAGCVKVTDNAATVTRGSERLGIASATYLLHLTLHLSAVDPRSDALGDVRRRYNRIFPPQTNFNGLPFHHTLDEIRRLLNSDWRRSSGPSRDRRSDCEPETG